MTNRSRSGTPSKTQKRTHKEQTRKQTSQKQTSQKQAKGRKKAAQRQPSAKGASTETPSPVPKPDHRSAKALNKKELQNLLVQFVSEKLAHAHLSSQMDAPTRQLIESMSKVWREQAETIIKTVRSVDRQSPPTSFWDMQVS